jgi:hypothetical protein
MAGHSRSTNGVASLAYAPGHDNCVQSRERRQDNAARCDHELILLASRTKSARVR